MRLLLHADEACQSAWWRYWYKARYRARRWQRCTVPEFRGVLRSSNGVASCIGYHADHLELQFLCDVPGSLMCSANQFAHN